MIGDLGRDTGRWNRPHPPPEVLTQTARISVRFNHPVVAFTTLDACKARCPSRWRSSRPAGSGRWLDTSTCVFTPKDGLAPSTSYTVRAAAGLQDQTGGALRQEYSWQFSTITPQVLGSLLAAGAQYASPSAPIQLVFNQPVDLNSLRSALTVTHDGFGVPGALSAGARPSFGSIRRSRRPGRPQHHRLCGEVHARRAARPWRQLHAGDRAGRARQPGQRRAGRRL